MSNNVEVSITVNGSDAFPVINAGPVTYHCFSVKTGGDYQVVISEPGATPPATGTKGIITVTNNTSYEPQLVSFTLVGGAPNGFTPVVDGEVEAGDSVWCAIVVADGTPITVTINDKAPGLTMPSNGNTYYCFSIKTAGDYVVVVNLAE